VTAAASPVRPVSPPPDPWLPALGLLDCERLAQTLTTLLAGAAEVTDAQVTYLEYSPAAALVLQASAAVNGVHRSVVIRAGREVDRYVRASGAPIPDLRAVVHWLPFDPHLRLLAASPSEISSLISNAAGLDLPSSAGASLRLLSYVPGRRATFTLDSCVVKTYGTSREFRLATAALELLGDGAELPTPRALAALPAYRMTVQERAAGMPADRRDAIGMTGAARHVIDRLHSSSLAARVHRDPSTQLRSARSAVRTLAAVLPDEAPRALRVLQRLGDTAPRRLPLVPSHGDFSVDQLLVTPDGGLTVTDVDNACRAPAALDVASFAANVMSGRPGDQDHSEALLEGLLVHGPALPGIRWYYAAMLLRRCDRPFRRLKKGWPEKSTTILEHAERVCATLR